MITSEQLDMAIDCSISNDKTRMKELSEAMKTSQHFRELVQSRIRVGIPQGGLGHLIVALLLVGIDIGVELSTLNRGPVN